MPLIIVTGIPCSGKSTRANELKSYFEKKLKKKVHLVSENIHMKDKNVVFKDSSKEKELRGTLKSEVQRFLGKEDLVILDAGNYIKGFRYELYCLSKSCKTTQCTVHCEVQTDVALQWNGQKSDAYDLDVFNGLVMRYEAPDSRNRWDSPLFTVFPETELQVDHIHGALYLREPPPSNQSTQSQPLSPTNYLHELDKVTQEVVAAILDAKKINSEGCVSIPGYTGTVDVGQYNSSQLNRLRRQFINYARSMSMIPDETAPGKKLCSMFLTFINNTETK